MVETTTIAYFEKLFTEPSSLDHQTQNWKGKTLTNEQSQLLIQPVSRLEIKEALFSLKSDSAPGPDGYSAVFFKDNWEIIGDDLLDEVEYFFKNNYMYYPINATSITLILKVDSPIMMKDFRPISCCNITYKVITKILVRRLKPLLPSLFSDNQSAFVKGRTIQSNVLLIYELVKNYKDLGGPKRCDIKVDILKAFDTVK